MGLLFIPSTPKTARLKRIFVCHTFALLLASLAFSIYFYAGLQWQLYPSVQDIVYKFKQELEGDLELPQMYLNSQYVNNAAMTNEPECHPIHPADPSAKNESFCAPNVLVAGVMKCGTNAVGDLLALHPRVALKRCKGSLKSCTSENAQGPRNGQEMWEQNVFTSTLDRMKYELQVTREEALSSREFAVAWQKMFPRVTPGSGRMTFMKSPSLFLPTIDSFAIKAARATFPWIKVVIVICNPVPRSWSMFNHVMRVQPVATRLGMQMCGARSFDDIIDMAIHERDHCPFSRGAQVGLLSGQYILLLQKFAEVFGDQVRILSSDDLLGPNAKKTAVELFKFAGLPPDEFDWNDSWHEWRGGGHYNNTSAGYSRDSMPSGTECKLEEFYRPSLRKLTQALDFPPGVAWLDSYRNESVGC